MNVLRNFVITIRDEQKEHGRHTPPLKFRHTIDIRLWLTPSMSKVNLRHTPHGFVDLSSFTASMTGATAGFFSFFAVAFFRGAVNYRLEWYAFDHCQTVECLLL